MTEVFKTKWFNITKFNYEQSEYFKLNQPEGIVILPHTKDNKLILIEQYRPCQKRKTIEFPSGCLEKNESNLDCAKRELLEETGYTANSWDLLGTGIVRLERENTKNYFYLARDCQFLKKNDEQNGVKFFDKIEFKKLLTENKFDHIAATIALIWAKEKYNINFID
tara:strand:+ start:873 stop:1370 length:498 start_codon:yes stop_codon:yes gene_type:complete